MLGFSPLKIIVLIAIIVAVWYGFKIFGRGRTVAGGGAPKKRARKKPTARWR